MNLDKYEAIEIHWIVLYVNTENLTYFDSLGVEHIPKEVRKSLEIKMLQSYKNIIL